MGWCVPAELFVGYLCTKGSEYGWPCAVLPLNKNVWTTSFQTQQKGAPLPDAVSGYGSMRPRYSRGHFVFKGTLSFRDQHLSFFVVCRSNSPRPTVLFFRNLLTPRFHCLLVCLHMQLIHYLYSPRVPKLSGIVWGYIPSCWPLADMRLRIANAAALPHHLWHKANLADIEEAARRACDEMSPDSLAFLASSLQVGCSVVIVRCHFNF